MICPSDTSGLRKASLSQSRIFVSDEMSRFVRPCFSGPFAMTDLGVSGLGTHKLHLLLPLSEAEGVPPAKRPSPSTNKIMLAVCVYG